MRRSLSQRSDTKNTSRCLQIFWNGFEPLLSPVLPEEMISLLMACCTVAVWTALAGVLYWVDRRGLAWGEPAQGAELRDNAAQRFVSRYQVQRLAGALEVYRLETGSRQPLRWQVAAALA